MNGEIYKIENIGEIDKLEEINEIEFSINKQMREISLLLKAINNYFDNPGMISAHRQMKEQEGGKYVWTSAHQSQQRDSHAWHDSESLNLAAKRDDAILDLTSRGIAVHELNEKYIEVWVLTTEWTKRHAAIEKLEVRRAEIVEQEILRAEIVE
jgi:hypothetical protein